MRATPCECEQAGWCARHQSYKSQIMFAFCRRIPRWFALWERGRGPKSHKYVGGRLGTLCMNLGAVLRTVECPGCRGHVLVKVYSCCLHGDCALGMHIAGVVVCSECRDYVPPDPE